MEIQSQINEVQKQLREQHLDGWLLYDLHGQNRFVSELLAIPKDTVLTRRYLYWIPQKGAPEKVVHQIESDALDFLPGKKHLYLSWKEFEDLVASILKRSKTIAMEYSPRNANPYVSVVDAGTIEMIRDTGVEVVSSDNLLQHFTSVLTDDQIASHIEAASVLTMTLERAWDLIADRLRSGKAITEYDMQKFILSEFAAHNCIAEEGPSCAVNGNSASPHYMATKEKTRTIAPGDYILIDLWCKKDEDLAVYADLTRIAVAAPQPTPRQQEIFEIVKEAQLRAINLIRERMESGNPLQGSEVDDVCREYINDSGYGEYFTHRTGHNIGTQVHGAGAHLDNFETSDHRYILPGTCFSIEPGIYLPNEFGVRLECDILIRKDRSIHLSGGTEDSILCLL